MKRPKVITEKELLKIEKEAEKVKKLQQKVKDIYQQLRDIDNNNTWVRYLSGEMQKELTLDQSQRLYEATEIIIYASKFNI